jgi:hypothetical protein
LVGLKIHPLARVVALAERFAELVWDDSHTATGALNEIGYKESEHFERDLLVGLMDLFKFQMPYHLSHKIK